MLAVWIPDGMRLIHGPWGLCVDIARTFGILQQCGMTLYAQTIRCAGYLIR